MKNIKLRLVKSISIFCILLMAMYAHASPELGDQIVNDCAAKGSAWSSWVVGNNKETIYFINSKYSDGRSDYFLCERREDSFIKLRRVSIDVSSQEHLITGTCTLGGQTTNGVFAVAKNNYLKFNIIRAYFFNLKTKNIELLEDKTVSCTDQ